MPKNLILPSLALLLIAACSSSGDQDASAEKTFQVTPTLGSLKSDESVPGFTDNTAMPVEFTGTEIITYQGFAGITPKFADDTPQDQQFAIMDSFSGHADKSELLEYFDAMGGSKERVFLVHGEPEQSKALQEELQNRHNGKIEVAQWKSIVEL